MVVAVHSPTVDRAAFSMMVMIVRKFGYRLPDFNILCGQNLNLVSFLHLTEVIRMDTVH